MKKIYIAMAVLGTVALISCEREESFNELTPIGENGIAFTIGGVSTRSAEAVSNVERGVTLPVGNEYFLKEEIMELNPSPATKGAPAYTVNVGTLYPSMGVYAEDLGDATFDVMDMYEHVGTPNDPKAPKDEDKENGNGWRYHHNYADNPWPNETTPVDFFLRMPAAATGVSNLSYTNQKITFNYSSQEDGSLQQDILFSHTKISKREHDGYLPNGAPVLMYHALTGIKFRSGSANGGPTKTIITKVVLDGLNDTGKGTFDPSTNTVTWPAADQSIASGIFSLEYENTDWSATANKDNTIAYVKDTDNPENNKFGDSWYSAAADKNLNDEDGSLTFWLIPQTITKDVTLTVYFHVKTENTPDGSTPDGKEITHTIKLGEALDGVQWKAGQLRTYTLDPKDVDVDIFDQMSNLMKNNLEVTNTGNVDEYVRVMLMGNWYGWFPDQDPSKDEASIMVGYTTSDMNDETMVANWYFRDDTFGGGFDDTFKKGIPANGNRWERGTGSYYYWPDVIGAGDKLSSTSTLFKSYTLQESWIPTIWIPVGGERVQAKGVHLVFECAVQAIGAKKPDGSGNYSTCWEAWTAAVYPDGSGKIEAKPFSSN